MCSLCSMKVDLYIERFNRAGKCVDKRYRRDCSVSVSIDNTSKGRVLTLACKTEWSSEIFRSVEVNAYRERMENKTFIIVFHDINTLFHFEKDSMRDLERFANQVDYLMQGEEEDEENVDGGNKSKEKSESKKDEEAESPQKKKGDFRVLLRNNLQSTTPASSTTASGDIARKVSNVFQKVMIPLRPSAKKR